MPDKLLIYRSQLLLPSETFIYAQAQALKYYDPVFAGLRRVARSLPIPTSAIFAIPQGAICSTIRSKLYRLNGFAPGFHEALRKVRPRLIHAHFALDGAEAVHLADTLGVPLVVTLHGYDVTMKDSFHAQTPLGRLFLRRRARLWERAALFICVSNFIREKALEAGFPQSKLCTHYIGIDRNLFRPQANDEGNKVVFVGRLVEKKGCAYLIRAMEIVQRSSPTSLVIIGDGPLRQDLESLAKSLSIRCSFLGAQNSTEIAQHLQKAAVFCVPSITASTGDSEGLGMVFLEAQAIGVPVASFRHGGIPEAIRDSLTGLLAPEGNVKALAENILILVKDLTFRKQCGIRATEWISERFDLGKQTIELEQIYTDLLKSGVPS